MRPNLIIENANIYTVNPEQPRATCAVIEDGRFTFVGEEPELEEFCNKREIGAGGETKTEILDAQGKFIMPAIIDSHAHISCSIPMCQFKYPMINQRGKDATLKDIAEKVHADAGESVHFFMVRELYFQGEEITKEDLDEISTDEGIFLLEFEPHSGWCNSRMLEMLGIDNDTPDPAPGFSYLVRDDAGNITGRVYEGVSGEASLAYTDAITDEYIKSEVKRLNEYCKRLGISAITECAMPAKPEFGERVYRLIAEMDKAGEIDIDINGSYGTMLPKYLPNIIDEVKRYNKEFNTEHLRVRTMKLWIDGTSAISTSCMLEPRFDNGLTGGKLCDEETLTRLIKECDANDFDVHLHVIGDASIRMSLNAVENARNELGRPLNVKVTLAHVELCSDADVKRFKELDVIANFTPYWMSPPEVSGGYDYMQKALGDRFKYEYRVKDIADTGAVVNYGCDQIGFGEEFMNWSPFLSMEVGVLRRYTPKTMNGEYSGITDYALNPDQASTIEQMIEGYTINGAEQLRERDKRGSIEVGKQADFVVLPKDLTKAEIEGLSYTEPEQVYFKGERVS